MKYVEGISEFHQKSADPSLQKGAWKLRFISWVRNFRFFNLIILFSFYSETIFAFEYGQCLNKGVDSFNLALEEYSLLGLAKADINSLTANEDLKWNFDTTSLIKDLVKVKSTLIYYSKVLEGLDSDSQKYLHDLLNEFIFRIILRNKSEDQTLAASKTAQIKQQFISKLSNKTSSSGPANPESEQLTSKDVVVRTNFENLEEQLQKTDIIVALRNVHARIQEAGVGASVFDLTLTKDWIALASFFETEFARIGLAPLLANLTNSDSLNLESFESFQKKLPGFSVLSFPSELHLSKDALQVVNFFYLRSLENFLFNRKLITAQKIKYWRTHHPKEALHLLQVLKKSGAITENLNSITDAKLTEIFVNRNRVRANAFDHYVWNTQAGDSEEKAIDGVARTLYGEALMCENAGLEQFKAISAVIALRVEAIARENRQDGLFGSQLIPYASESSPVSPNLRSANQTTHTPTGARGASDFGRFREGVSDGFVSEMPMAAQVVSRPGQFSVWKMGQSDELPLGHWIHLDPKLGYPDIYKIRIDRPAKGDMDAVQSRVLCPEHDSYYEKAVELATELIKGGNQGFLNKYSFHNGSCSGSGSFPYFYTHNRNLNFARRINPVFCESGTSLPITGRGPGACAQFRLWKPKINMY